MAKLKIPRKLKILGHEIKVVLVPNLTDKDENGADVPVWGLWQDWCHTILLNPLQPRSKLEHTYLHELVHAILETMGRHDLSEDEDFVDMLAGILHQVLTTAWGNQQGDIEF